MEKSARVKIILSQIRELDYESKLYLAERLNKHLRKNKKDLKTTSGSLSDLNSLGSEIWKDVDIDVYLQQERQWD